MQNRFKFPDWQFTGDWLVTLSLCSGFPRAVFGMGQNRYEIAGSVEEVIITAELAQRPFRSPDYEAQCAAMAELTVTLSVNPGGILDAVSTLAMRLCGADSAGVAILEEGRQGDQFRWHSVGGSFPPHPFWALPREASPCGVVIARNEVQLFDRPDRFFAELRGVEPRVSEALLAPWRHGSTPMGTLWVASMDPDRHFDQEDVRVLNALASFAASAHGMFLDLEMARAEKKELEQRIAEQAHMLSGVFHDLRRTLEMEDGIERTGRKAEKEVRMVERQAEPEKLTGGMTSRNHNPLENISSLLYDAGSASSQSEVRRFLQKAQQEIARLGRLPDAGPRHVN